MNHLLKYTRIEEEYEAMVALGDSTIIKRRYRYHYAGQDYSIDAFEGHLSGLVLAEIESQSESDISTLPVPEFAIREVTNDPLFTGGKLAELSQDEFQAWLATW